MQESALNAHTVGIGEVLYGRHRAVQEAEQAQQRADVRAALEGGLQEPRTQRQWQDSAQGEAVAMVESFARGQTHAPHGSALHALLDLSFPVTPDGAALLLKRIGFWPRNYPNAVVRCHSHASCTGDAIHPAAPHRRSLVSSLCAPPMLQPTRVATSTALTAMQMRGEIVEGFPEYIQELAAEVQAAAQQGSPLNANAVPRHDFTGQLALAIDDATTMDVDDAVAIEALACGGWRVWVHVADPTEHVASGSALDLEAMQRCDTLLALRSAAVFWVPRGPVFSNACQPAPLPSAYLAVRGFRSICIQVGRCALAQPRGMHASGYAFCGGALLTAVMTQGITYRYHTAVLTALSRFKTDMADACPAGCLCRWLGRHEGCSKRALMWGAAGAGAGHCTCRGRRCRCSRPSCRTACSR